MLSFQSYCFICLSARETSPFQNILFILFIFIGFCSNVTHYFQRLSMTEYQCAQSRCVNWSGKGLLGLCLTIFRDFGFIVLENLQAHLCLRHSAFTEALNPFSLFMCLCSPVFHTNALLHISTKRRIQ